MNETIDLSIYQSIIQLSNQNEIEKLKEKTETLSNGVDMYRQSNNQKILFLKEKENYYGIYKPSFSDTFYLCKADDTKLEKNKAMKFIEDYFDVFSYFFHPEDTNSFYEYTAKIDEEKSIVMIKTFKEKETPKRWIKK